MTTQPSGSVVQGGLQPSCSVPMTVHLAGRCSSNSSSGQPLLQRTAWWKSFDFEATGGNRTREATFGLTNWKRTYHGRKPRLTSSEVLRRTSMVKDRMQEKPSGISSITDWPPLERNRITSVKMRKSNTG